ncbi:MAG: hypothetical protein ABI949_06830 [Ilumatobacteraceae bacterium]
MKKRIALISLVAFAAATACGSSDGAAATATAGDSFCTAAQGAKDDNDALKRLDPTDSAKVKVQLSAAIDSLSALVAKAPTDIVAKAKALLANEVNLEKLLQKNNYDVIKFAASDEGKALIADKTASKTGDDFDAYLTAKCGIASDNTSPTTSDTTVTGDSVASGDSSPGVSIDLGEGDAAINKFLDFYELGTSSTLSDSDRTCIVSYLSDKVTGDDLNKAIAGTPTDELSLALGQAFISCNVTPQS